MDHPLQSPVPVYDSADEYFPEPEPEPLAPAWCDGSVRIGMHTSIAGGLTDALESARKLGCNALQIFSASPRMWARAGARINGTDAARFRARRAETGLGPLAIHANYLINLGATHPVMRTRSIQSFHDEMVRAMALGADFLIVHPGSANGREPKQAIPDIVQALRQAARGIQFGELLAPGGFGDMRRGGLRVLLENTSGMGSAVGSRFEELQAILEGVPEMPLGVCLDTAHAFEAGYDLRSEAGLAEMIAALEGTVGLGRVAAIHLNDSKTACGSRVDRHEHIGRGKIGREAFRRILTHPRLSASASHGRPGRAFLLETPIDAPGDDRRNVRAAWELAGIPAQQAPQAENGFSMRRKAKAARRAAPAAERSGAPKRTAARKTKGKG